MTGIELPTPARPITDSADPQSIAQLFAADPEDLSDGDIDRIVAEYRSKRKLFLHDEAVKSSKGRQSKGTKDVPETISLGDILL